MKSSASKPSHRAVGWALLLGCALPAHAGLTITTNTDTLAGRQAYVTAGTTQTLFDWDNAFNPGTFTPGLLGSVQNRTIYTTAPLADATVNTVVGANSNGAPLAMGNWIDGDVFDSVDGAAADLAINGVEAFDLLFGRGHRSIGLAVASGTGNLPNEYDLNGAQFVFRAFDSHNVEVGSATLLLAPGSPQRLWMTLNADSDFSRIEVREIGAVGIADQYFSNIYTSVEAVPVGGTVPEPGSLALAGMALAGLALTSAARPKR
jgi:PEP-CTERM motif